MDANQFSHLDSKIDRVNAQLDKMDGKLDNHLERVAKLEVQVENNKGNIRILFSLILTGVTVVVTAVINYITGGILR